MITLLFAAILPLQEMITIKEVAKEYGLNKEQTALLVTIRKIENGKCGLEFGVGQEDVGHAAKRFKGNPHKSFRIQAQWAAGTIKRRYTGDISKFAARWCPKNKANWAIMGKSIMKKALKEV